jgi:hypothetical protein
MGGDKLRLIAETDRCIAARRRTSSFPVGTAINNNAVRSITASDTNLEGWSGQARERHVDSPDASIKPS